MAMLDPTGSLPDDASELRSVAAQLAATVKSQALEIAKLRHQLAGHRRHRFGSKSESEPWNANGPSDIGERGSLS